MKDARAIAAIAGIVILDAIALFNGIDGVFFMTCVATIAGLGGYIVMKEGKLILPALPEAIKLIDEIKRRQAD